MVLERLAPAKLNLGLHVLRRRTDGFHDIETVFLRIPWADRLVARTADALTLSCSDPGLPTDEGNLCMQAAQRLAAQYSVRRGAALHLEKRVPYGAGLGGGSSDAAATLLLLAELWGLDVPARTLHELAAALGSDVPFFLGPPAAYGTGRGEILTPLLAPDGTSPYQLPFPLVVAVPPIEVATARAYASIEPNAQDRPDLQALVPTNDLARWRQHLVNDFEAPVLAAYPAVRAVREALLQAGAAYVSLSGSGAAVFGVFPSAAPAEAAAEALRQTGHRTWHGFL